MNFRKIDKWSLKYAITKVYVAFAHNKIFYRKVSVLGKQNLPENTPLFFAPNHQNALMDALVILCNLDAQPVFIARADIFKNAIIARILIFLKILPAYRIRDGKENLKKNEEIFDISVKILENKNLLTLFPETTHTDKRQLRILKKGVQRIVFQAEEKNNFKLGVQIVPTGIYYSNYWNFKSDILVYFGKPILLNEYLETYKENPQKGMLTLRDKISEELSLLMIDIQNEKYYDLFEFIRTAYCKKMLKKLHLKTNLENKFKAYQKIIAYLDKEYEKNPKNIEKLNETSILYKAELKKLNIRHWVVEKNEIISTLFLKTLGLAICSPLFLYGFFNNLIPYYLPKLLTRKLEDRQFTSSITFVMGLIFFPLFYLIQFLIVWIFFNTWWIKFIYLLTLPLSGLLAFNIHRWFVKLKAQWKYSFSRKQVLKDLKDKINNQMNEITYKPDPLS